MPPRLARAAARARRAHRAAAFTGLVLAAACGAERATEPSDAFDAAAVLADATGRMAASTAGLGMVAGTPVSGDLSLTGPRATALRACAWQDAAQMFACAPTTIAGVTHTYGYAPLDASGDVLRSPTRATTAALRTVGTSQGTLSVAGIGGRGGTVRIDQRQDATLRGLLTDAPTLDAVMTATLEPEATGGLDGGRVQLTQTTAGLVLPARGARWPSAGTVTTVFVGGDGLGDMRMVTTFNGTSTVALVLALGDGPVQRCTLDLAAAPSAGASALRCEGD